MPSTQPSTVRRAANLKGLQIRYERSFLLDIKNLEVSARKSLQQFVFEEFPHFSQLQDLPEFRQLGSTAIYYRFSFDRYLISIELTGQIVKFLRVLPRPDL